MTKLATALAFIPHVLSAYPALSAALVNIAVVIAAYCGLHITGQELIYMVGVVTALSGAVVHSNVTPLGPARAAAKAKLPA